MAILSRVASNRERKILIKVPENEEAIKLTLNFLTLFSHFHPNYEIYFFGDRFSIRSKENKIIKKYEIRVEGCNKKFKRGYFKKIYNAREKKEINSRVHIRKRKSEHPIIAVWAVIKEEPYSSKNKFLEQKINTLTKSLRITTSGYVSIRFLYRNNLPFSVKIPFINDDHRFKLIIQKPGCEVEKEAYGIGIKEKYFFPKEVFNIFYYPLYVFSEKENVLTLIDILIGKINMKKFSQEFCEDLRLFSKRINIAKDKLYYIMEGIMNEEKIENMVKERTEIFKIPLGYERFYLRDILRALGYFFNPNSNSNAENAEKMLDFFNQYAKLKGNNTYISSVEEFYEKFKRKWHN